MSFRGRGNGRPVARRCARAHAVMAVGILARLLRRPKKYIQADFWKTALPEARYRLRAHAIFALPSLIDVRKPRRAYLFPMPMNRYQLAESYVAWKVLWMKNIRITTAPAKAVLAIAWNPSTCYELDSSLQDRLGRSMPVINSRCTDIRKSTVGRHFERVFGYSMEIDPRTYSGTILRKSERNGAHDAVLLQGPLTHVEPGYVYQRLISNPTPHGMVEWRVFIVGTKPVAVHRAYRPLDDRFRTLSSYAQITESDLEFSAEEQRAIQRFNQSIGLDFGALDVLRDSRTIVSISATATTHRPGLRRRSPHETSAGSLSVWPMPSCVSTCERLERTGRLFKENV